MELQVSVVNVVVNDEQTHVMHVLPALELWVHQNIRKIPDLLFLLILLRAQIRRLSSLIFSLARWHNK